MKSSCLPLCLSLAVFSLFWTPSAGLKTLRLGSCVINADLQTILNQFHQIMDRVQAKDQIRILSTEFFQDIKTEDQCCILRSILELYLLTILKNYSIHDNFDILQKMTSIANNFFDIKEDLSDCDVQIKCPCGEEALKKVNQIQSHYKEP